MVGVLSLACVIPTVAVSPAIGSSISVVFEQLEQQPLTLDHCDRCVTRLARYSGSPPAFLSALQAVTIDRGNPWSDRLALDPVQGTSLRLCRQLP